MFFVLGAIDLSLSSTILVSPTYANITDNNNYTIQTLLSKVEVLTPAKELD